MAATAPPTCSHCQGQGCSSARSAPPVPLAQCSQGAGVPRRLVVVLAVACGVAVANLYYAQPLLHAIAVTFGVGPGEVGLVVTLTQVGYALGLVLLVPLGDRVDRRRLVVGVTLAAALALAGAALSPDLGALAGIGLAVGGLSVVAQVLVPFAATLASDAERGKVVGTVMSGLLLGILLARALSGALAQVAGWRSVYWVAGALMLGLALVLHRQLPSGHAAPGPVPYRRLLASVVSLLATEPVLRRRAAYGACTFATFSVLWTSLAFLLTRPPYRYGEAVIGLFGLAGVAGALCASVAGRLADRGLARLSTGVFVAVAVLAWALLDVGGHHLVALVAGVVVLDLGAQGVHITNQAEIYRLRPEARSRLTTAYMTSYFIGGAVGSAASALVFARAGWPGVCLLGLGFVGVALGLWLTELGSGAGAGEASEARLLPR